MSVRYFIENGQTISPPMGLDWDGCLVSFLFFNGAGQPVNVVGLPTVSQSLYDTGNIFKPVQPFSTGEWRFNGPASRVQISLSGVTGYTSYRVIIWRTDDPMPMIPDGAFTGRRALISQSYVEANVKSGSQFGASTYLTALTANETIDTIVITGAKKVIIKGQYLSTRDSGDVLLDWYKAPTYTGGQNLSAGIYNQSDVNRLASTVQLIGVAPTNPAGGDYSPNDATKPTITNVGTKISPTLAALGITGQGSSTASQAANAGLEQVLDANSVYLFRRTSRAACAAMFGFSTWFEGEPDLPISPQ